MASTTIQLRQVKVPVNVQNVPLVVSLNGTKVTVVVSTQLFTPVPVTRQTINLSVGPAPIAFKIQPINVILPITGAESGLPGPPGPAGSLQMILGETPNGIIDGLNKNYTSAYSYSPNKLSVFLNGLRQRRIADYSETGSQSFSFITAPLPGDSLCIDYVQP